MDDDAVSPFSVATGRQVSSPDESEMSPSLRPTKLEKTMGHHPWLDFSPLPKMRDSLIRADDIYDDKHLLS
ncbi:hypothetical protein BDV29DRAFT_175263 [Aspergillus leporis]|uniref:Uncharacterized protein n=1 Tax=Aspergillus leporis TaxID=41062 RepID=A0A5N5WY76_9EURO|nr:hypothetical protein BDV29DRAFT_175263 [Aspergillus leporis]